jgi:hypothetical protein
MLGRPRREVKLPCLSFGRKIDKVQEIRASRSPGKIAQLRKMLSFRRPPRFRAKIAWRLGDGKKKRPILISNRVENARRNYFDSKGLLRELTDFIPK